MRPALLQKGLDRDRIHAAYLISGPGSAPRRTALDFVRALVCERGGSQACEACAACRRSREDGHEPIRLDGAGRKGPLLRHVGDHPDLLWIERGADDTRVRIAQVRALQAALRLRIEAGRRRAAVIADAEWLNQEAQNALLRLLEEPPERTTLILVTTSPAGLLATVRSRCQRIRVAAEPSPRTEDDEEGRRWRERFEGLEGCSPDKLLHWAEELRGARATSAARTQRLLAAGSAWLRDRVHTRVPGDVRRELEAFHVLQDCRRSLVQYNANPQMIAERAWLALWNAAR